MKNIPNKIKELYSAEGKESKKKMENMVILLIILIITCIAVNKIWNGDKKEDDRPLHYLKTFAHDSKWCLFQQKRQF